MIQSKKPSIRSCVGFALFCVGVFLTSQILITYTVMFSLTKGMIFAVISKDPGAYFPLTDERTVIEFIKFLADTVYSLSSVLSIISNALTVTVLILTVRLRRMKMTEKFGIRKAPPLPCIATAIFAFSVSVAIMIALSLIPFPDSWVSSYTDSSSFLSKGNELLNFIAAVIAAPICEELVFRGGVYRSLSDAVSRPLAIFISSLIFGVMHGTAIWVAYTFVLGIIMCWIYDRFNSLIAPIIFHAAFNLFGS